eukprot:TRINITY_DN2475_c0_g1_i4.p1 TRINITY_DN2475_c0_g1~~TRINITY_DN2475_c0_g1_i4.p1  ORF type:complete len:137 (+),score=16.42 TRINITY_DN2475_c0_g1_i4:66-476(+)
MLVVFYDFTDLLIFPPAFPNNVSESNLKNLLVFPPLCQSDSKPTPTAPQSKGASSTGTDTSCSLALLLVSSRRLDLPVSRRGFNLGGMEQSNDRHKQDQETLTAIEAVSFFFFSFSFYIYSQFDLLLRVDGCISQG